jgi:hypothetical protein
MKDLKINYAKDLATAYVKALRGPPNGWGQFTHPLYGRSDHIMFRIRQLVGEAECNRLIDEAMNSTTE